MREMSGEIKMGSEIVTIGMDDIDSPQGGCTTHFTSLLVEHIDEYVEKWLDYPHLIRLNPNIPYRTRGNGATSLRFSIDSGEVDHIEHLLIGLVRDYANVDYPNTNPGVVLAKGNIPNAIHSFSQKAIWRALPLSLARRLVDRYDISHFKEGNGRGLVGALAAAGHGLSGDHTYEYIAYRGLAEYAEKRGVDPESVNEMERAMHDRTFSNINPDDGNILIEPQGQDPVLYGIRGETPRDVIEAASYIRSAQSVDRWMVFKTNQGTAEHLKNVLPIGSLRPYMSVRVRAVVADKPRIIEGGHVIFRVGDDTGSIDCAAYEPTGKFRWEIMKLIEGDEVVLDAGVRPPSKSHGYTLNVEGLQVTHLVKAVRVSNPLCKRCGKRMKSAGKNKGFKCPKCGFKDLSSARITTVETRDISVGYYLPQPSAQRHLTRPYARVERRNSNSSDMIEVWHSP